MIYFTGDINFTDGFFDTGFGVGSRIKKGFDPFNKLKRSSEDIWIGNFEGVSAKTTNKTGLYAKQFNIDPKYLSELNHFNYYSVANNHIMQHGSCAYEETLENINLFGSDYFGDQNKPTVRFNHQNKQISVTSFSLRYDGFKDTPNYWYNPEIKDINREYEIVADCDFKVLYLHWGNEFIDYPYEDQKKIARALIDIGFDLIIGMHPHLLQGYEVYNGKYIFYSIGNFVFNMPSEMLQYGAVIKVNFEDQDALITYDYVHIEQDYFPIIVDEIQVPIQYRFSTLNNKLTLKQNNEEYYQAVQTKLKSYRIDNYKYIIINIFNYKYKDITEILKDYIKRKFLFN